MAEDYHPASFPADRGARRSASVAAGGDEGRNRVDDFYRIKRLPPYVLATLTELKVKARARGEDIIDLGMGNPDRPTPGHIVDKLVEAAKNPRNHRYSASRGIRRLRVAIAHWIADGDLRSVIRQAVRGIRTVLG